MAAEFNKEIKNLLKKLSPKEVKKTLQVISEDLITSNKNRLESQVDITGKKFAARQAPKKRKLAKNLANKPLLMSLKKDLLVKQKKETAKLYFKAKQKPWLPYYLNFGNKAANLPARQFFGISKSDKEKIIKTLKKIIEK